MFLLKILVFLLAIGASEAALAACASGVTCPPGGLWSEWSTSDTCDTSCGSCSSLYYTRTCLSTSINCSCSGNFSMYTPCNTKACLYPSQKSCCDPYVSMIINNTLHCGPIPKDTSSSTTSCCPVGGLWSVWSGFARDGSTWTQTRRCLSSSVGCNCTGSATNSQTTCPCPTVMSTAAAVRNLCMLNGGELYYSPNSYVIDQDTCTLTGICKANNLDNDWPCAVNTTWKAFSVGKIRMLGADGKTCYEDLPYDCNARLEYGTTQLTLNISFTCDPNIQQWRYDASGDAVLGYELIQQTYRGAGK